MKPAKLQRMHELHMGLRVNRTPDRGCHRGTRRFVFAYTTQRHSLLQEGQVLSHCGLACKERVVHFCTEVHRVARVQAKRRHPGRRLSPVSLESSRQRLRQLQELRLRGCRTAVGHAPRSKHAGGVFLRVLQALHPELPQSLRQRVHANGAGLRQAHPVTLRAVVLQVQQRLRHLLHFVRARLPRLHTAAKARVHAAVRTSFESPSTAACCPMAWYSNAGSHSCALSSLATMLLTSPRRTSSGALVPQVLRARKSSATSAISRTQSAVPHTAAMLLPRRSECKTVKLCYAIYSACCSSTRTFVGSKNFGRVRYTHCMQDIVPESRLCSFFTGCKKAVKVHAS